MSKGNLIPKPVNAPLRHFFIIAPKNGRIYLLKVKEYPKVPLADLAGYCAAGTYLNELFYSPYTHGLSPKKTQVVDKINNQEISWARGVLLYEFARS